MTAAGLLDPDFIRELEALKRRLVPRARSGRLGERAARRRGGTAEFAEHRHYAPGDDLRRIDWLAFARSGEPLVKVFHADEDTVVRLLLDGSGSLAYGSPSKFDVGKRLAAALGYLSLASSERSQVILARPSGAAVARAAPVRKGRAALSLLLRDLAAADAGGALDLNRAVDHVVRSPGRPGVLVVLSDFYDSGPLLTSLSRAVQAGHDVRLVQIVAREELSPSFEGDCELVDAETGEAVEVTMDADAVEAYVLAFAGLVDTLRAFARTRGAGYLRVTTDEPLEPAVRRFVERGID